MEELIKDDPFAQFIINDYLADSDIPNEEKLVVVCSSTEEFTAAMDCFKLNGGTAREY